MRGSWCRLTQRAQPVGHRRYEILTRATKKLRRIVEERGNKRDWRDRGSRLGRKLEGQRNSAIGSEDEALGPLEHNTE